MSPRPQLQRDQAQRRGAASRHEKHCARADDYRLLMCILSAAFGLIAVDTPIPWYDRQMDLASAVALQPQVQVALRAVLTPDIDAVFIALSWAYLPALGELSAGSWAVTTTQGGIGQLCRWLYEEE